IPMILAGQGGGMLKTGRYVRYSQNQQIGKLHLSLLQKFGVEKAAYGENSTALAGLDSSDFEAFQEPSFKSWVKSDGQSITVQGRLRMSDDLDEAKLFFIDVQDQESVRIDVSFGDFHHFNLAYHCGTPITLTGTGQQTDGQYLITKLTELNSLFGKKPGTQNG
ncbi:hypothetical protein OAG29_00875, partial [Planctomycetaceae bacterium]|nr:hypothetical protein [Planctomycetaceae bacterium]